MYAYWMFIYIGVLRYYSLRFDCLCSKQSLSSHQESLIISRSQLRHRLLSSYKYNDASLAFVCLRKMEKFSNSANTVPTEIYSPERILTA